MIFFRGAKRSIEVISKSLNGPECGNSSFSTWPYRGSSISPGVPRKYLRAYATDSSEVNQLGLIKQLRAETSAPIVAVKSALIACNWDTEAAKTELRKMGIITASKRSSRIATEGLLAVATNGSKAAIIELNCETDFVARNDIFQYMALSLAKAALLAECPSQSGSGVFSLPTEDLQGLKMVLDHKDLQGYLPVDMAITEVASKVKENIILRRAVAVYAPSKGIISTYLHTSPEPGLGRIAGILSLEVEDGSSPNCLQHIGSELAMHIVASKPLFLTKDLVSSDALENEREILKSQAEKSGKSQMAIEKMVEGRLRKYYEEVVLMEQKFVVNDSVNVKTVLDNLSKEVGSSVRIDSFCRMEVGEGIQRLDESKDEEVAQAA